MHDIRNEKRKQHSRISSEKTCVFTSANKSYCVVVAYNTVLARFKAVFLLRNHIKSFEIFFETMWTREGARLEMVFLSRNYDF